ncbi:MAG: hypothetical protein D6798_17865 [Deltaproteobacteria bacterium]|nr:MAG: hypothetical protein D6798_17865 [Deltaproteobacteria bacterium]
MLDEIGATDDSDDEALLLEAEATVDELVDTDDLVDEAFTDSEEPPADVAALTGDSTDLALQDADARLQRDREAPPIGLVHVSSQDPRQVYVGRADGLWMSRDGGVRWTLVSELPGAAAMVSDGDGLLVGAADGLWASPDGRRFHRELPGLGARAVHALVADAGWIYAGTEDGLWRRDTDGYWQPAPATRGLAVFDVLPDPAWDGGLWLATAQGLLRSDDGGETVRRASRNPLREARHLLALPEPGHLLAAGDDGAWESMDGGTTWAPLAEGLDEPVVTALLRAPGGTIHLLGRAGAFALQRASSLPEEEPGGAALQLPDLDEVVARALERPGLSMDQLSVARRVVLARFAPKLDLLARYYPRFHRVSDYVASTTWEDAGPYWMAEARFCWGLCDDTVDVFIDYEDLSTVPDAAELADLGVVGGEVYDFRSDSAVPVAAANVAAKAINYRTAIADIVTRAWFRRRELAAQEDTVANLSLAEQIAWRIDVEEVEARLDLYTDGWYARAIAPNGD